MKHARDNSIQNTVSIHHWHSQLFFYQMQPLIALELWLCILVGRYNLAINCNTECCLTSIPPFLLIIKTSNALLILILVYLFWFFDSPHRKTPILACGSPLQVWSASCDCLPRVLDFDATFTIRFFFSFLSHWILPFICTILHTKMNKIDIVGTLVAFC